MEKDEFEITFSYKNSTLSAIVRPEENEISTYTVEIYSPGWEIMIEISADDPDETGQIEWLQVEEEVGQVGSDPELIQMIGNAILNSK
jgi:hypothetical protein